MYKIFPGLTYIFLFLLGLYPGDASAALVRTESEIPLERAYNPNPDAADILLPMPCGTTMAFRAVGVPARGFLWDFETSFGTDESGRGEHDYYERRYDAVISAPFSVNDLPVSWRKHLPTPPTDYYYYLIGKYEVTSFQWRAVMENWCPTVGQQVAANEALPKTGVSWFEAQDFARKHTEWLLENKPEALPKFAGDSKNTGFLRLPFETEWEYAARGGHAVSRDDLRHSDFFPLLEGEIIDAYAVYRPEGSSTTENKVRIGTKKANSLGIYDMHGNVAEMVQNPFHFSKGRKLHGSAGGFIFKGGSYRSNYKEILSGRREEMAYYFVDGVTRRNDVGIRLIVAGINTPGGERPALLEKEWKQAGESGERLLDQGKDPLEEIGRIIAQTSNTNEKENLRRLRAVLKDNNIALERQNNKAAEGLIRSSTYMVETVKNYAVRRQIAMSNITGLGLELSALDERKKQREDMLKRLAANQVGDRLRVEQLLQQDMKDQQRLASEIKDWRNNEVALRRSLLAAAAFYRDKIDESLHYPAEMISRHAKAMLQDLGKSDDMYSRNMQAALKIYEEHVRALRAGRNAKLSRNNILKDILPERFMQGLFES